MNAGINLRVLKKARDFITRRTTTGLSKRILPHIAVSLKELGHFHFSHKVYRNVLNCSARKTTHPIHNLSDNQSGMD